jgi:hypothetical protein
MKYKDIARNYTILAIVSDPDPDLDSIGSADPDSEPGYRRAKAKKTLKIKKV